jgi:hypothetical protein
MPNAQVRRSGGTQLADRGEHDAERGAGDAQPMRNPEFTYRSSGVSTIPMPIRPSAYTRPATTTTRATP